jgi:hypothetical protein
MIKVICIDDSLPSYITLNKIYDAEITVVEDVYYYRLIDDIGDKTNYYTNRFKLLSDWREEQIKTVLDD